VYSGRLRCTASAEPNDDMYHDTCIISYDYIMFTCEGECGVLSQAEACSHVHTVQQRLAFGGSQLLNSCQAGHVDGRLQRQAAGREKQRKREIESLDAGQLRQMNWRVCGGVHKDEVLCRREGSTAAGEQVAIKMEW
jgi:hypothetical protein